MTTYVFGYGSIVNRRSLARGLRRAIGPDELIPARLAGFARVWGASERVRVDGAGELDARFLDLVAREGATVNGVLVPVTADELGAMRVREKCYGELDVSGHLAGTPAGARVVAFGTPPGTLHRGTVVLAEYVRLVEEGFAEFGADFLGELRATTDPAPVPLLAGAYRLVDPEQNRLTTRGEEEAA